MSARMLDRFLRPIRRAIQMMAGRAILRLVDDSTLFQTVQVEALADELLDGRERMQNYGFTGHPHPGAEAIVLAMGGSRNHAVIIAVDDRRYRLQGLAEGEVALYDDRDQVMHLKRGGIRVYSPHNILIETDGILRLEGDGVEIHGRRYVQSDVHGKGKRETYRGGVAHHTDTYLDTHTATSAEKGLDQPHIPSEHPEAK